MFNHANYSCRERYKTPKTDFLHFPKNCEVGMTNGNMMGV